LNPIAPRQRPDGFDDLQMTERGELIHAP
jgi:hypothetical protein